MAERRGPPETCEDETTGLGVNTTLKGKGGGGLPEDCPGPPGEPGGTAAITADEGPPAWGQRQLGRPGLGVAVRPAAGWTRLGLRREETDREDQERRWGEGTRRVQSAMDQEW